ncbi:MULTISPECIES: phosphonate C-P lyase system protein PhnH [Lonsdalea]|uniref:Carbon-phosphorus lyase subunit PhnH n=2 Tax=Lonsdalea TaxID=1082702 RepID=A0ACD1JGM1_9GAMM|nr:MULTISPECIES: phosphonate C-P lyase system protein PhnH [Lonsdalea]OSN01884.1 carbon-phosphorus lyase subunit PhnH [Lonsdalea populi]QPQ23990.1 phosphonate C-P lyase system protein PhnH [Lonsdalea populi]RAT16595.1 carbon-phosphorus lyase subunit PhnH [Lonsdalea quercina]RAT16737.1 carbon-phosphorus lyase subunit PhnH [Lonsdalea quercina]RAT22762.1 carbon-phosphorus lyase subunit PhnH [Lonsdalea populi]
MNVTKGFPNPAFGTQACFRKIVKAMSEPGVTVNVPGVEGLDNISSSTIAVLLTLTSHKTQLFIDNNISNPLLLRTLCLHAHVPITASASEAHYALLNGQMQYFDRHPNNFDLMTFSCGNEMTPEKSTTIILEVDGLNNGRCLKLSGPGVNNVKIISPHLPAPIRRYLCERPHAFPMGLDFLFTSGKKLLAIPRTTRVEEC